MSSTEEWGGTSLSENVSYAEVVRGREGRKRERSIYVYEYF